LPDVHYITKHPAGHKKALRVEGLTIHARIVGLTRYGQWRGAGGVVGLRPATCACGDRPAVLGLAELLDAYPSPNPSPIITGKVSAS
jgi:hypothetical protein